METLDLQAGWAELARDVRAFLERRGAEVPEHTRQVLHTYLARGDAHPELRSKCFQHMRLELEDMPGSPFDELELDSGVPRPSVSVASVPEPPPSQSSSAPTTTHTPGSTASANTLSSDLVPPPPTSSTSMASSDSVWKRTEEWLSRHSQNVEALRKAEEARAMAEATFRPQLIPSTYNVGTRYQNVPPAPKYNKQRFNRKPPPKLERPKSKRALVAPASSPKVQRPSELEQIVQETHLDRERLQSLMSKYVEVVGSHDLHTSVPNERFGLVLQEFGITDVLIIDRLFHAFANRLTNEVNFRDVVAGLSTLTNGSLEDVLKFCFRVYDSDDDGMISREELHRVLCAALQDDDEDTVLYIVMMVFKQYDADGDGRISLDEFTDLCAQDPLLLDYIRSKFTQATLPTTEESYILSKASKVREQVAFEAEQEQRRREAQFQFDPTSTETVGRFRLQDPDNFEIGSDYRKASGQKGISLVCARSKRSNDIMVIELRFDRVRWPLKDAAEWYERNEHRFDRAWFPADWERVRGSQ